VCKLSLTLEMTLPYPFLDKKYRVNVPFYPNTSTYIPIVVTIYKK